MSISACVRASLVIAGLALFAVLALGACAADVPSSASAEQAALANSELEYSGATYGGGEYGGGVVRWRGNSTVKACQAGLGGVGIPIRFTHCYCEQLVKDCGQDLSCPSCSNPRYEQCSYSSWVSGISPWPGCTLGEYNSCVQHCATACASSCKQEF